MTSLMCAHCNARASFAELPSFWSSPGCLCDGKLSEHFADAPLTVHSFKGSPPSSSQLPSQIQNTNTITKCAKTNLDATKYWRCTASNINGSVFTGPTKALIVQRIGNPPICFPFETSLGLSMISQQFFLKLSQIYKSLSNAHAICCTMNVSIF